MTNVDTNAKAQLVPLSPFVAAWQVTRLEFTRVFRGRALRAAAGIVLILVIAATVSCFLGDGDSRATFVGSVRRLFPWLAMGLSLLFAARTVSDDIEAGILHYFFLLPVPRWSITLGKYLACAFVVGGLMLSATVLLYLGTHLAEPSLIAVHHMDLWRALGATMGAALCYTALFLFLGAAVADLPYLLPLLYVAVFEIGFGALPVAEVLSLRHHLNVLLGVTVQASSEGMVDQVLEFLGLVTPTVPIWVALVVIGSSFVVFLGFALLVTEFAEYRTGKP